MASRGQSLVKLIFWPGGITVFSLLAITGLTFHSLLSFSSEYSWEMIIHDQYLWHIIWFTFWQASLSTLFSIIPAIPLALSLYRRHFWGRRFLLRLCSITLVLPVLVVIFGILSVYGKSGYISHILAFFNVKYTFSPYGLQGIVFIHVFFNLPFVARLFLSSLNAIPIEQRQLVSQLNMSLRNSFQFLEWPWMKRHIWQIAALVFMLCFSSFAAVLTLGGGPKATTLEVALYQALSYDFNTGKAAQLALIQISFCLIIMFASYSLTPKLSVGQAQKAYWKDNRDYFIIKIFDYLLILLLIILIIPPLSAIFIDGLNSSFTKVLWDPYLWKAVKTSVFIAFNASSAGLVLTFMLLWSSRSLKISGYKKTGDILETTNMITLALPSFVLATGLFLTFQTFSIYKEALYIIVIIANAMLSIPYMVKILSQPMFDIAARFNNLCASLNIYGWNRLHLVELSSLKLSIQQAFAYGFLISLGDFGIIALFGSPDFITLPLYLYQQIGSYKSNNGAVAALILLILCLVIFSCFDRENHSDDHT